MPVMGPDKPKAVALQNTQQAVQAALVDARSLPAAERCFFRYIWVQDGAFKPANLVLNLLSRGLFLVRALPRDRGRLLRIDLRLYGRDAHDLEDMIETWELLRYDPTFSLLVTEDNLKLVQLYFPEIELPYRVERIPCAPYRATEDGKVYDYQERKIRVPVARFNPDYLAPDQQRLQELLQTEAPLVLDKYFMHRATTTVKNFKAATKNDSLFTSIWGGLYYEFRGIKRANAQQRKAGVTDEDLFYRQFGINKPLAQFFAELPSDQRSAIEESDVTGKMRRVDFFNTAAGKGWDIMGIGSTTHDFNDADIDVLQNPLMNLLRVKDAARESIMVSVNGMHAYAIFDGNGNLLDEADLNAVTDRTVPAPKTPKLQCAQSCLACHEAEGSNGWRSVGNDVKLLLNKQKGRRLDVFDDQGEQKKRSRYEDNFATINRIVSLYQGDFQTGLRRGRDDYARVILRAGGPQGNDQTDVVRTGMGLVVDRTRGYFYDTVSPAQALTELGVAVEDASQAPAMLETLCPPEPAGGGLGFLPEDPRLGELMAGIRLQRFNWAFLYTFTASRIYRESRS